MTAPFVLGIDVSKDSLDVVLLSNAHSTHQVFANTPSGFARLASWLSSQQAHPLQACLEATGQYSDAISAFLYQRGDRVSVINPAVIKHYADSKLHRNKTDKADAALIAEYGLKETPPAWHPLPDYLQQLRELVRRVEDLQLTYQQERNRLASGVSSALIRTDLEGHLEELHQRIENLRAEIQQQIARTPELNQQVKLLVTISGIGEWTAARLLAEIGEVDHFTDAPQLAAYAGLNPKGVRSGSSVHKKTQISKKGRAFLRKILYMPALVARRHNPIIRAFCDRLEQAKLPKKAIIVAAMRKLLHLVYGILKHQRPFDPHYLDALQVPS